MDGKTAKKVNERSFRIDLLKAAAIIAVVLYHSGNLEYGYLGVEVFFVITGYFFMNSYLKKLKYGHFSYLCFFSDKILRLWPLILIICLVSLSLGYFSMLPDDFENLGQSVVASSVFLNNILAAITTKNYWNFSNDYKPLMHLWYAGVLVQLYFAFTLAFWLTRKYCKRYCNLKWVVAVMTIISIVLFILPVATSGDKFYYIPFRAFEILAGACVCLFGNKNKKMAPKKSDIVFSLLLVLICVVFCFGTPFNANITLIIEVLFTTAAVYVIKNSNEKKNKGFELISKIGSASFSIYIVHQPIMAFTRYYFTSELTGIVLVKVLLLTVIFSFLFFIFEKCIVRLIKKVGLVKSTMGCVFLSVITISIGLCIHENAGVVRDVPELDIYKKTAYRGMNAEYVDVPYSWNKDFETDRIHVLVVGDSMARDWCNILHESKRASDFEISYIFGSQFDQTYVERLEDADYIFYSCLGDSTEKMPEELKKFSKNLNFYVVGIKNFGECNGQIYQKRFQDDYFESTIIMGKTNALPELTFDEQNEKQKEFWGEHYIDMIECIRNEDGSIPVFTDTKKYISADTEHLTKNGAIYYANVLDLSFIK